MYLDGQAAHHLVRVLRMREGDEIGVLDGSGRGWIARLTTAAKSQCTAHLLQEIPDLDAGLRHVELALPFLKGEKLDWVLQKCTELGVSAFHLVPMERAVVRFKGDSAARVERYSAICRAAAEQCGAFRIPQVRVWEDIELFLDQVAQPERYIAWERHGETVRSEFMNSPGPCVLATGPEGGISEEEINRWKQARYQPVSLGRRILRAETAAVAMASLALCAQV